MMRKLSIMLAAAMFLGGAAAPSAATPVCTRLADVPWYGWNLFFANTSFGTVGFARDDRKVVYVPEQGTDCILLPTPKAHFYIVFNHRQAETADVGYVSFKLYGLTQSRPSTHARALARRGNWHRDTNTRLPGASWAAPVQPSADGGVITGYEAEYAGGASDSLADFDRKFGLLHGTPDGSVESSWDGRVGMQPDSGTLDLSRVSYLRHELQRVEVSPQTSAPGDPPMIETHQFQYGTLLVSVASPLGEGTQRTLLFRFGN